MSEGTYVEPSFERDTTYITDRITVDGAGDGSGDGAWPVSYSHLTPPTSDQA